jgi:hypothetical protein
MAEQGGSFSDLATVIETVYLATGLTYGTVYEFKIESRS